MVSVSCLELNRNLGFLLKIRSEMTSNKDRSYRTHRGSLAVAGPYASPE